MTSVTSSDSNRYPLPLYLNQKYVFDVLSMMERGFSRVETITTRSADQHDESKGVSGGIGFGNVFGLLSVSLGGGRSRQDRAEQAHEVSAERVHTPNSLFARMRERLFDEELVVTSLEDDALSSGSFIELTMRLEKNPLLESLETLLSIGRMAAIFEPAQQPAPNQPSGSGSRRKSQPQRKQPVSETEQLLGQIEELMTQLSTGEVVDLIGRPVSVSSFEVVLTLDLAYAGDRSLSDLIDGEYRVLGKVTRLLPEAADERISLLRKTSLGRFPSSSLIEVASAFQGMQAEGLALPDFRTEIEPPVVQVLPIAVFA